MPEHSVSNDQQTLIQALARILQQQCGHAEVFETHISWIVVANGLAYKFKKIVHFDFADFSTLEARHFYCQEELRLNRRLSPELYLAVVRITGSALQPRIDGAGEPIEYAVKMRAFPQQALWSDRIGRKAISSCEVDQLADKLAQFHRDAAVAPIERAWGSWSAIQKIAEDNARIISACITNVAEKKNFDRLAAWQTAWQATWRSVVEQRKRQGCIRECHGDLHSGNILTLSGQVVIFDCIEFNPDLRWIDVMDDLAFICMDLQFHGLHKRAARLLNAYLEASGDYDGLKVLNYYVTQRALVRAKVAFLRAGQLARDRERAARHAALAARYLAFALASIHATQTALIIMHGISGSGKSTVAKALVELTGGVQLRSDVERKRMHGIVATSSAAAEVAAELYDQASTDATYGCLLELARCVLGSGRPVIVDAAFLDASQRNLFADLATESAVPLFIVDLQASESALRQRVVARAAAGSDASDAGLAVLEHQLAQRHMLSAQEKRHALPVDSEALSGLHDLRDACGSILEVLRTPAADNDAVLNQKTDMKMTGGDP